MSGPRRSGPKLRALFVIPSAIALLAGLDAGLDLLGTWTPATSERLRESHGILMVLGFVGSLVSLERAVALKRRAGFLAPLGLSLGSLSQLSGVTAAVGGWLIVAGAAGLVALYAALWRRQRDDAVLVETMGAVLGLGAAVLWRGGVDVPLVLPWLAGFLVLTIVGERLELARLAMPAQAAGWLLGGAAAFCVSVVATLLWPAVGAALLGASLAGLGLWLVRHDVARRTVRAKGLTRFMGASMLCGQFWLAVAAGIWLVAGPTASGESYDAVVHAVFLGFTMSMIMAHAPVILPAVTGIRLDYHWFMYVPAVLLQLSLLVRLWFGDALGSELAHRVGGSLNVVALLLFFLTVVTVGFTSARATPKQPVRSTQGSPARPVPSVPPVPPAPTSSTPTVAANAGVNP